MDEQTEPGITEEFRLLRIVGQPDLFFRQESDGRLLRRCFLLRALGAGPEDEGETNRQAADSYELRAQFQIRSLHGTLLSDLNTRRTRGPYRTKPKRFGRAFPAANNRGWER